MGEFLSIQGRHGPERQQGVDADARERAVADANNPSSTPCFAASAPKSSFPPSFPASATAARLIAAVGPTAARARSYPAIAALTSRNARSGRPAATSLGIVQCTKSPAAPSPASVATNRTVTIPSAPAAGSFILNS